MVDINYLSSKFSTEFGGKNLHVTSQNNKFNVVFNNNLAQSLFESGLVAEILSWTRFKINPEKTGELF